jgi:hypothetical protein
VGAVKKSRETMEVVPLLVQDRVVSLAVGELEPEGAS